MSQSVVNVIIHLKIVLSKSIGTAKERNTKRDRDRERERERERVRERDVCLRTVPMKRMCETEREREREIVELENSYEMFNANFLKRLTHNRRPRP